MFTTFNMGVGYVLVVPKAAVAAPRALLARGRRRGHRAGRDQGVRQGDAETRSTRAAAGGRGDSPARRGRGAHGRRGTAAPAEARGVFRLAVLASGSGSNLQAIIDQLHRPRFQLMDADDYGAARPSGRESRAGGRVIEVALVVSDVPGARALERATRAGIPTAVLPVDRLPRPGGARPGHGHQAARGGARPGGAGRLHAHRVAGVRSGPSPGGSSTCTRRCCRRSPAPLHQPTPCATGSR